MKWQCLLSGWLRDDSHEISSYCLQGRGGGGGGGGAGGGREKGKRANI